MRRPATPAFALALLLSAFARAAEQEPIDEDFLEYLASVEDKDDNWTLVAEDEEADKQADRKQAESKREEPAAKHSPPEKR